MVTAKIISPGLKLFSNSAFALAADLGQSQDYTAIAVIEHVRHSQVSYKGKETPAGETFDVRYLRRLSLGLGDCVFPGMKQGKPLSNMAMLQLLERMGYDHITTHGFRSSFRDWAAEQSNFPSEVAEMALAHSIGSKVEAAYRRGSLFEKRIKLMNAWASYCSGYEKCELLAFKKVS